MRVLHHERLPLDGHFSIERLFREIRRHIPEWIEVGTCRAPLASKGIFPRLRNVRHAAGQRADVHHVVGDSHYLGFGLPSARTVQTIHDCAALDRLKGFRQALLKFFWFTGPMRRAAVVTTISEASKQELRRWVGGLAEKVVVIPDCLCGDFRNESRPFNERAPVVLQIGTKPNKNLERVAEALATTGCELHVVGELSEVQKSLCHTLGVVFRELGALTDDDLVEAYSRSDMVVFASLYEGFGLPILEAQASGKPVITSNISSLPEAAGQGALLVDPYSMEAIRGGVMKLKNEPGLREVLVSKGLENLGKFRPAAIAAQYAEVYRRVAALS